MAATDPDCGGEVTACLHGKSVLVVEDNGFLCGVLEDTLRIAGCKVVGPFARLHDALCGLDEHIDVALLDISIRGQLVVPVAQQLEQRGIPYVLTSGYRGDELPRLLQGAPHLRKPFADTDLLLVLSATLQGTGTFGARMRLDTAPTPTGAARVP
jgi:CheY-like chemotaxis protein